MSVPHGIDRSGAAGGSGAQGMTGSLNELADPGADRILFWDDSAGGLDWMTPSNGTGISGTSISVKDFGAVGDGVTDDTAAIQAAIDAVPSIGGEVWFPAGAYLYSTLTVTQKHDITLTGAGGAILRKSSATGYGLNLVGTSSVDYMLRFRLVNLILDASVTQTSGAFLRAKHQRNLIIDRVWLEDCYIGMQVDAGHIIEVSNFYIRNPINRGFLLASPGEVSKAIGIFLSNGTVEGTSGNTTATGIRVDSGVSGLYLQNVDVTQGATGIYVVDGTPGDGAPEFLFMTNTSADQTNAAGWQFDGGKSIELHNCWGASSATDNGLVQNGATGVRVIGGRFQNNDHHGILIQSGSETHILGALCAKNSVEGANSFDGIHVAANVSEFQLVGNRCGNITGFGSGTQGRGIQIAAGTSTNYAVVGNDLHGNGTEGFTNGATGSSFVVESNLPRLAQGSVASASSITLPPVDFVQVTGTTNIDTIVATDNRSRVVILQFTDALTVNDGTDNILLAGSFTTTALDTLTLVCDGTNWLEISRSVN